MLRFSVRIIALFAVMWTCNGNVTPDDIEISTQAFIVTTTTTRSTEDPIDIDIFTKENVDKVIVKIEELNGAAQQTRQEGLSVQIHDKYEKMAAHFGDILEMLTNFNNAYEFLKVKGLDRIVITCISNPHEPLRKNVLILLKTLLEIAPSTTNALMPARMIDKLIEVFEKDDHLDQKARVIDILHIWLPKNPRVQARVMKAKGLQPFYDQMKKLDIKDLHTLLDLFNKILKEHLDVRYNQDKVTDDIKIYQRIGLIEHISTKDVCDGLLNIFRDTWMSVSRENDIVIPVLDLSMKIAPYCVNNFRGKAKAEELYTSFLNFLKEKNRDEYFARFNLKTSTIESGVTDYINILKSPLSKDEF